jgi:hypothetical protein
LRIPAQKSEESLCPDPDGRDKKKLDMCDGVIYMYNSIYATALQPKSEGKEG